MRTTAAECSEIGHWIGEKLNACDGEVRFLIPENGVSAIDIDGRAVFRSRRRCSPVRGN